MADSVSCHEAEVVLVDSAVERAEQMAALCNAMIARRDPGSKLHVSTEPSLEAALPEVIAEVTRRHQVTFKLAARAADTRDHDLLVQSIQLCPFDDYLTQVEPIVAGARAEFGEALIF